MDWVTISALATAAGTLVLALATFAAVRSANRSARVAERALLAGLRPMLMPSRFQDVTQKIGYMDSHWLQLPGGHAVAEVVGEAAYLAISVRNAGTGIAVMHGWRFQPELALSRTGDHPNPDEFTRLTRDLYVAAGEVGFWQERSGIRAHPGSRPRRGSRTATSRSRSRSSTATSKAASAW